MFNRQTAGELKLLDSITKKNLDRNDKRVVNAIGRAFEILEEELATEGADADDIISGFDKAFGMDFSESYEYFMLACYNTAQYERGLEICDLAQKYNLLFMEEIQQERAELFGHLGEIAVAEKILLKLLDREPENLWHYISLGDLYNHWQVLPEKRNFKKAEDWYYKAYDNETGIDSEDWPDLLERLGDICVERLRFVVEKKLLEVLESSCVGRWPTLEALRQNIYLKGPDSLVFQHLEMEFIKSAEDKGNAKTILRPLHDFYHLMPQKDLGGSCPFEMTEFYTQGEHSNRIISEKIKAYIAALESGQIKDMVGAEASEEFDRFQRDFMEGKDLITGKKRRKILKQEWKNTEKQIKKGTFVWLGFEKFRNIDNLSELAR